MTSESHNTRLDEIKQDIQDFKSDFNSLLSSLKNDLRHIDKVELGFPETNLFFDKNFTPYNQKLAWKSRELKLAGKKHSTWSIKGVIKLRRTMNEHAISIEDEIELSDLYPDFVFRERQKQVGKYILYFSQFCVSFCLGVRASFV